MCVTAVKFKRLGETFMKTRFESLGVYLPEPVLSTAELIKKCNQQLPWDLEKITGVRERHVAERESAYELALSAARRAIGMSRYKAEDLDLIICTSISRYDHTNQYTYEPCQSASLKGDLHASQAEHFDIVNACAGMFTGITIVNSMLKAGAIKTALVVSGEMISYTYESAIRNIKQSFDGQFATLTLGDAGAAVILDATESEKYGLHYINMATGAKWADLCIAKPSPHEAGGWMQTNPVELQQLGVDKALSFYLDALDKTGWTYRDLDVFIPHQTSRSAILKFKNAAEQIHKHKLDTNFIVNVQNYGNTASTSHFIALHESFLNGNIQPDQNIQFGVVASGFEVGMATYTMDDLPLRYRDQMTKGAIA